LLQITLRALIIGAGLGIFFAIVSFPTVLDTSTHVPLFTFDQCASFGDVCAACVAKLLALSTVNVAVIGSTEAWTPGWSISGENKLVSGGLY